MAFQYFYRCGAGKSINKRIKWFYYRQTKKETITKSNISRRKTKALKEFKPIYSFNISIKSGKNICILNLPKIVVKTLGRYDRLSKKDINMDCSNHVVKET